MRRTRAWAPAAGALAQVFPSVEQDEPDRAGEVGECLQGVPGQDGHGRVDAGPLQIGVGRLDLLDREMWLRQARADMAAKADEDLSGEPDAW